MKVVVTGATGNVGTALLRAVEADRRVREVVGIARRRPALRIGKVTWLEVDVTHADLRPHFSGADAVVHLAWLIQPSRDERMTHAVNVEGSARVFEAAAAAGVGALVYASSAGAYSPGPKDRLVGESWPTDGIPTSFYARHKVAVERILDSFETAHPEVRTVRLRPGLVFQREAASEIRRLFAGPLLPNALVRRGLVPVVPSVERLRFQAVHAHDVGEAYRLAVVTGTARGAFNIAAGPVLDAGVLAEVLGARPVPVPAGVLRAAAGLTWRARLQPTPPGWLDMALAVPLMDTTRASEHLGWTPRHTSTAAFLALFGGLRDGAGYATPPLDPQAGGPLRLRELVTGAGHVGR